MKRWPLLISFLVVFVLTIGNVSAQEQTTGQLSGKLLTTGGAPMNGGLVYIFFTAGPVPDPDKYWRVPDFLAEMNDKGEFSIELPEGDYYLGAIKRKSGKTGNGPPEVGDYFYKGIDKQGTPIVFVVKKGENHTIGSLSEAMPFKGPVAGNKISAIEGRVIGSDGKPVEGALVFAFLSESMIGRPNFASNSTGKDGKYLLRVHEGGNYYLRARDIYGGGPPEAGALIGTFGGEAPKAVVVKTGAVAKGIDITVEKFKGRGIQQ
jgi:hypothetical protein